MTRSRLTALTLLLAAPLAASCGSSSGRGSATPGTEFGDRPICGAFNPLIDLRHTLTTAAVFGASSALVHVVDADEELGASHVAARRLKGVSGGEARAFGEKLGEFVTVLEARREKLGQVVERLQQTFDAAESAVITAAKCKGVDMRDPYQPAGSSKRGASASSSDATEMDRERRAKIHKANLAVLASPACESAVRLWTSVRQVDLTSDISSSSVASHIDELRLDKERTTIRGRVTAALQEHAEALRQFQALVAPRSNERGPEFVRLNSLRSELVADLDAIRLTCLEAMDASGRVVGGHPEPRQITVTVRPKWGESLPHTNVEEFGSGFVVRWRTADGKLETRVVTNRHVMDGALEAEIIPGDPALADTPSDAARSRGRTQGWSAVLIQADPYEDVAILRLDPKAEKFRQGLTLRVTPAVEGEAVLAAGFPGIGVRPSFQVSRGIVSNARFGTDDSTDVANTYVQHTAPIDPGNSGGPLLDGEGRLLGMNTFKVVGRENVGIAVPTLRIQQALLRAEEKSVFDVSHARASCNAVAAALASPTPVAPALSRFALSLFEAHQGQATSEAARYRDQVEGDRENPVEAARAYAYGVVRAKVEEDGGVRPFSLCTDVREVDASSGGAQFSGTLATRTGKRELLFAEEGGAIRLVQMR